MSKSTIFQILGAILVVIGVLKLIYDLRDGEQDFIIPDGISTTIMGIAIIYLGKSGIFEKK